MSCHRQNVKLSTMKSRRDDIKPLPQPLSTREGRKSRRDEILLTGGFNLRRKWNYLLPKSRRDGTLSGIGQIICRPCGTLSVCASFVRRLKSTVNKMPSLRDFLTSLVERGWGRGFMPSLRDFSVNKLIRLFVIDITLYSVIQLFSYSCQSRVELFLNLLIIKLPTVIPLR